jgi:glycosyltransferase involved in cell wall biosynthesis
MNNLFLIGNEKINFNKGNFFSANIDFQTLVKGLKESFNLTLIARRSHQKENFKIFSKKIILVNNIISYLLEIVFSLKSKKNNKYLIISITPYTFFSFLILFFFTNNIYLYLRSDGFKEYESILGKKYIFIYSIMFYIMTAKCRIISCQKNLSKGRPFFYVQPSEINSHWLKKKKIKLPKKKLKLLYVGRLRVEKGIYYLLDLFSILKNNLDYKFTAVVDKKINLKNNNVKFLNFFTNTQSLINEYDRCDIFILPSYTESHPKVLDEALARHKPVIIFKDIKHIVENRKGVFVIDRNLNKLLFTINFIKKNYIKIVNNISKNVFPTKDEFIKSLILNLKKN